MSFEFFFLNLVGRESGGSGVFVKKWIVGDIKADGFHFGVCEHSLAVGLDAWAAAREHFDARAACCEAESCDDVYRLAQLLHGSNFFGREFVGDTDVATKGLVDVVHHLAEDETVRRCVVESVVGDVVVNHFVDNHIVEFFGREVEKHAETQVEIVRLNASQRCAARAVLVLPHESRCAGEADGDVGEVVAEDELVVFFEFLFYIRNGGTHIYIYESDAEVLLRAYEDEGVLHADDADGGAFIDETSGTLHFNVLAVNLGVADEGEASESASFVAGAHRELCRGGIGRVDVGVEFGTLDDGRATHEPEQEEHEGHGGEEGTGGDECAIMVESDGIGHEDEGRGRDARHAKARRDESLDGEEQEGHEDDGADEEEW